MSVEPITMLNPMTITPARGRSRTVAFTLIELLMVISIIGILAGMLVGLIGMARGKKDKALAKAMLNNLVTAIESYKAKFGAYPPDTSNVVAYPYGCNTNSLFYELTGVSYSAATATFSSLYAPSVSLDSATLVNYFSANCPGILNSVDAASPDKIKSFLPSLKSSQYAEINKAGAAANVLVFLVPGRTDQTYTNTWFYLAAPNARKNPTTFDLWAEFVTIKGATRTTNLIGNWKE